ncbi:MAG: hypothetical protein F6J86_33145 [Symploca sp. SIO1B1]|nr:hypothetical protein [Symploca sp. SIO1B1]
MNSSPIIQNFPEIFSDLSIPPEKAPKTNISQDFAPQRLQIASASTDERQDNEDSRYILVLQPSGIRAAYGRYTSGEAWEIARKAGRWKWVINSDGIPNHRSNLEKLIDEVLAGQFSLPVGKEVVA